MGFPYVDPVSWRIQLARYSQPSMDAIDLALDLANYDAA
jgi:hypothetical protein